MKWNCFVFTGSFVARLLEVMFKLSEQRVLSGLDLFRKMFGRKTANVDDVEITLQQGCEMLANKSTFLSR